MVLSIQNLPLELLMQVAEYLDYKDVSSFRLASRKLASAGTCIFRRLRIWPSLDSDITHDLSTRFFPCTDGRKPQREFYQHIVADRKLARHVREVRISAVDHLFPVPRQGQKKNLIVAINRLARLPVLRHMTLRFPYFTLLALHRHRGLSHSGLYIREHTLDFAIQVLANRTSIRGLAIENLVSVNIWNESATLRNGALQKLLKRLTALRIVQNVDAHPGRALAANFNVLKTTFLNPQSTSNLTQLVLYSDVRFGYWPSLDLNALRLPHLKTLALGKFTFHEDSQLFWILQHKDTLENLYLDNCAILYELNVSTHTGFAGLAVNTDTEFSYKGDEYYTCAYPRRWHHVFTMFRRYLRLRNFRFGCSYTCSALSAAAALDTLNTNLFPSRYLAFNGTSTHLLLLRNTPYIGSPTHQQQTRNQNRNQNQNQNQVHIPYSPRANLPPASALPVPVCEMADRDALNGLLGAIGRPLLPGTVELERWVRTGAWDGRSKRKLRWRKGVFEGRKGARCKLYEGGADGA